MRKEAIILILVILLSSLVRAEELTKRDVELTIVNKQAQITANEGAIFDIAVSNGLLRDSDFFIAKNFYSEKWRISAEPYILSIQSGFSKNTRLKVSPVGFLLPGKYELLITIQSRDGSITKELDLEVEVVPFGEENVKTDLVVNDKIDPRIETTARVELENLFNYDIDDLTIIFKSELFEFKRDIRLKANEKRVEKFDLDLANARLGKYLFKVTVKSGRDILGADDKEVELTPYAEVTEKVFRSSNFNKKIVVTKENTGTEQAIEKVEVELSNMERVLARYSIRPDKIEGVNGRYLVSWNFILGPGAKKEVVISLPYGTYLGILIVAVLFLAIIWYVTRRKVVLIKKIINVSKDHEGIRGIKIILHLKNKGNKAIKNIRIIEYLPKMVAATSQDFGTMRPTRIQKSPDGRTRLVWDLDGLDRGEERIISYIAKSKLSIIGKLILPDAVVEYHTGRKYKHIKSNRLTLFTKPSKEERRG